MASKHRNMFYENKKRETTEIGTDELLVEQALGSLKDLVHDPEVACEVLRLRIHVRLVRLMVDKREYVRQRALGLLQVLAEQPGGRSQLVDNPYVIKNLARVLADEVPVVRLKASHFLLAMVHSWFVVRKLVEASYIKLVLERIFREEEIVSAKRILLEVLEMLLDDGDDARVQGIAYNALKLVESLGDPCPGIRRATASVMSQLFQHPIGRVAAVVHRVVPILAYGLSDEVTSVATEMGRALMFATITTEGRKEIAELEDVLATLLDTIAQHGAPPELKMNCVRCLTNLSEVPSVRTALRPRVGSIRDQTYTHKSQPLCAAVNTLVETILWEP
ncbi:hypothetical protein AAG570_004652 [Ranatra chinensis]|uniref:Uncharacterized protein n=1 Tax=Ranatra chinensis TaxID=642074 RepID=A0ABD0Y1H1_9HEMI